MKIGRNDPCPCGSGIKYKKCCLSKESNAVAESNLNAQEVIENSDIDDSDDQQFFFNALNNMRKFLLGMRPHIKVYKKIRKLHSEIGCSMMDYYDSGKFEQKANPDYFNPLKNENKKESKTLVLLESKFNMETNVGVHAIQDMLIYKPAPNMNCITEEFIKNKRFRKPEKTEFLQSMLDSKLGLFEVTAIDEDEGYAYIKEVFTGDEYKLTDIGISGNNYFDEYYIYTRIITYHDVSFSTGLNFTFAKTDPFIQNFIKRNKKDYNPIGEFVRFTELYNRFSSDSNGIKVVTNTFK